MQRGSIWPSLAQTLNETFDYLSRRIEVAQTRMTSMFEITVNNTMFCCWTRQGREHIQSVWLSY